MKLNIYFAALLSCFLACPYFAYGEDGGGVKNSGEAFIEQLQERDSILVADQLRYGFRMENVEEGTGFALPDYSKGLRDSIEIVSPFRLDTLGFRKGKKGAPGSYDIEGSLVITSFDEGEYLLPPLSILRHSTDGIVDTLVFGPRTIKVTSMPVDTATFELHDIKGQVRYPLTFKELIPYIIAALLLALIVFAIVRHLSRRKGRDAASAKKEPAHIVALRKLDHLRGSKLWAQDKQKFFYSGVTDALREYMAARYGISAMEMTTKEIFDVLSGKEITPELYSEAKELFERADFVKFAKYVASEEENASAVPAAVRFVTQTYQAELDSQAEGQPESGAVNSVEIKQ